MKKIFFPFCFLFFSLVSCNNEKSNSTISTDSTTKTNPTVPVGEGKTAISPADYKKVVDANPVVLVDVSASWCGPCRRLAPHLDQLAIALSGKFLLIKSDSDRDSDLADSLNISSLPTLLLYQNGKLIWRTEGYADGDENTIAEKINAAAKH